MTTTPRSWLAAFFVSTAVALAQQSPEVIHLWPNGAPGFESRKNEPEEAKDYWVKSIHNPSVTVFRADPAKANGCAVVVAPGGGLRELVFNAEGRDVADYLNPLGVTVFVLKYRLPKQSGSPYSNENVREDAYRAMRLVRSRASEFGVDPKRIGFLGFSAGGEVATMIAFDSGEGKASATDPIDRVNGRPNFVMMLYPGGPIPRQIPADSPPAFFVAADDDEYGCDKVTMGLVAAYRAARVPVELHLIAQGKHAFNMGHRSQFQAIRHWPDRMAEWMDDRDFLTKR
jgi:acetyl esterase/lipase